jgi:hypothetical protein
VVVEGRGEAPDEVPYLLRFGVLLFDILKLLDFGNMHAAVSTSRATERLLPELRIGPTKLGDSPCAVTLQYCGKCEPDPASQILTRTLGREAPGAQGEYQDFR